MNRLLIISASVLMAWSFQASAAGDHRKGKASDLSKIDKAERKEKRAQKILERIDTNGDSKVDLSEYLANAEQRFSSTDADGDGYITAEEMKSWSKQKREEIRNARKAKKQAAEK